MPDSGIAKTYRDCGLLAVLLVIASHSELNIFLGGFVGVDVFFVLSGYLITGIFFRELESTHRVNFSRFFIRRLRRLLPAMVAMLVVVYKITVVHYSSPESAAQLASIPYAATWTSNVYFLFRDVGYFDELAS